MEHNQKAIRTLIWANAISGLAQGISMIAIPWYMVNHLQAESLYGKIFLAITICILFWAPYAGTIIDRYSRKNIFLALNAVGFSMLMMASVNGFITGETHLVMVISVLAFSILNFNLHYPALYTFTHEISEKGNFGRVNTLLEIQGQATSFLSGALAAVLLSGIEWEGVLSIRPWHLHEIFLADGITYLIAFVLISRIQYTPTVNEEAETGSVLKRLRSGWQYLLQNKRIMLFGMCSYVVFATLIISAYFVMQVYLDNHLQAGAAALALCEVTYTTGALASGFLIRKIFPAERSLFGIKSLMLLCISIMLTMAFTRSLWIFVVCGFLFGICNSGIRVLRVTWLFERVPNRMMGRAGSAFNNFNILVRMFLMVVCGLPFFTEHIQYAYVLMAAVIFIPLVILIVFDPEKEGVSLRTPDELV